MRASVILIDVRWLAEQLTRFWPRQLLHRHRSIDHHRSDEPRYAVAYLLNDLCKPIKWRRWRIDVRFLQSPYTIVYSHHRSINSTSCHQFTSHMSIIVFVYVPGLHDRVLMPTYIYIYIYIYMDTKYGSSGKIRNNCRLSNCYLECLIKTRLDQLRLFLVQRRRAQTSSLARLWSISRKSHRMAPWLNVCSTIRKSRRIRLSIKCARKCQAECAVL